MDETNRRRKIQDSYNLKHGIKPKTIIKSKEKILEQTTVAHEKDSNKKFVSELQIDPVIKDMKTSEIEKIIKKNKIEMERAAENLDFYEAARLRDENVELKKIISQKSDSR